MKKSSDGSISKYEINYRWRQILYKYGIILALFFNFLIPQHNFGQEKSHPLDPLTWQEYWTVLVALQQKGHLNEDTRFSHINLVQPDKSHAWSWKGNAQTSRKAFAIVHQAEKTFRAEVDLNSSDIYLWKELRDIQPSWLEEEFGSMIAKVKQDPRFISAMKKRGYDDLSFIEAHFWPPGYFDTEEQKGRRIAHSSWVDVSNVRNTWARPIEGLVVVVDMNTEEIVRVVDEGVVPVPQVNIDYDRSSIKSVREVPGPIFITQPQGRGFTINGHIFQWQNWEFHVRPDHRVGMIISTVSYKDKGAQRKVLYEGYLSEIFVPYMDPAFGWYPRNFIDAGEYTAGGLTKPLLKGLDAPDHAYYMDGLVIRDNGRPKPVSNMIAIFERESGDPSWRHYSSDMEPESRAKRDLVIRCAAVLGNYDYIFDWIFQQDGSIKVLVGATGIAEAKAVIQKDALSAGNTDKPKADAYGRFVDPHVVAVNHDHYFSFRMDMDVDGSKNNLLLDRLRTETLDRDHPRRSIWVTQPKLVKTESEAKLKINLDMPALWRVISDKKNHVGYPTSYQLMPGMTGNTLLSEDDYPRKRVGFINYHLWATPFEPNERFAVGDFPTLSLPGKGLPEWTSANRSLENTDIVLWYTVGMHHMVRAEDWPVMPVLWHSFELRPFDFFDENPALNIPRD